MTPDEKQFYDRKAKIDAFKSELKALIDKYDFGIHEIDRYNGEDNYIGGELHFVVDGETFHFESIAEIFDAALNHKA